ncbi:MAG TPA: class IV adenylate cyclase [Saprospiraceae bacterium]|nr:class IV adenylate cyclase [Saprospiraceae bacterium]HMP23464.1 class IV adenylate cyclase [Saprospiraceae bacterium]
MQKINIEIKAHCANPADARQRLLAAGARFIGEDHQVDTYFKVGQGRLKLREGNIENALIHYQRQNEAGPKKSDVRLYASQPESSLKAVLTAALGILTIVDKRRAIFFIENVKFHVDEVENLGSFVEIEAIGTHSHADEHELAAQCQHYMELLRIRPEDLIEHSYSDLLLKAVG